MKRTRLFNHINIDEYSATPKYLQLTNSIKDAIIAGKIKKDDLLPSINELSCILEISRDTAEKGYKHLKSLGIVNSVPGKGYYISNVDFRQRLRIFLLFNKLSSHKKIVYDAFVAALGEQVAIDFYIYNNDFALFKKLLENKKEDYSHYVIIPHFIEGGEESHRLINEIPKDKLVLLDKLLPGVEGEYAAVYENFENDIYQALEQALDLFEDIVFHSIFPEEEMNKEKEVILDEIASYQDQPDEAINDDFEDLLFEGHPLGRNILGTPVSVHGFTKRDIVDFHRANYRTDEIIIGIYGDYDFKTIIRLSEKLFAGIPSNLPERKRKKISSCSAKNLVFTKPINQSHCVIGNRSYSMHHQHKTAFLLLNNLLGGTGMSSRLNLEIREKYGIAYTIESNYTPMSDTGIFSIYFGTETEKKERALKLVEKELRKLREQKLGPVQLRQAKDKFIGQIALGEENRMGLLISMSKSLLDYGRVDSLEEIFAKINAVSDTQVLEIANEMFDPKNLSSMIFNPKE